MVICGIKMTHDGGIALIENNRLVFSIEMEKINNNFRFSSIENAEQIEEILLASGYQLSDVDRFVVDGWDGLDVSQIRYKVDGVDTPLSVAPYRESKLSEDVLKTFAFNGLQMDGKQWAYHSYYHVTGHIAGAYCTSPFAQSGEGSYILVWDGGMFPRLYYFDPVSGKMDNFGALFFLIGNIYHLFAIHFEPFKSQRNSKNAHLSIAGKVMAYIAKGQAKEEIIQRMFQLYEEELEMSLDYGLLFARKFIKETRPDNYCPEDVLASFHVFIQRMLLEKLKDKMERNPRPHTNLCFVGGCALNIKWNSAFRRSGLVKDIWVPPFPNDSGSAIGAACAEMMTTKNYALEWSVYSGTPLNEAELVAGWQQRDCTIEDLASFLHNEKQPVIFLNGKAELGPRALGNRSILAAADSEEMKELLNKIKKREAYRPIAPICLEEKASQIFDPGTPDRYMLFDHVLRDEWRERIPAIKHLDNTARVQTVSATDHPLIHQLLTAYEKLSGIPVLTNTSANDKGRGFFPDVQSAMVFGRCQYVWSDNTLYIKESDGKELEEAIVNELKTA
ncbi:MAG: carbamoyltransferase N-terminal domain-containing protein [Bacteroidota bacterium]